MMKIVKEFRPSIIFLLKFLACYFVLNLAYGFYVNYYGSKPDPVTNLVTRQTSDVLNLIGEQTTTTIDLKRPNINLNATQKTILSVYEGCNGINTIVVFISFLLAYGKLSKKLIWFVPMGIVLIHLSNLMRIGGLYYVTIYIPDFLYFTHKFLFTGALFVIIFGLWFIWVNKIYPKQI